MVKSPNCFALMFLCAVLVDFFYYVAVSFIFGEFFSCPMPVLFIDVNKVASVFGGGGHMKASGCVITGTLEEAKKKVLAEVEKVLKNKTAK